MTGSRLPSGGLIDRSRPLSFSFDGRRYTGFAGDTLASALLANGVRVVGRSFKYHRPRGVWGAWVDDPNAIFNVTLNGVEVPNCQATTTPLVDEMAARAVNAFPNARFDLKGGLDLSHRWLGAGFYYKTFTWPDWHLFEPAIRRMAGLGRLGKGLPEGFISDQTHDACEVLVVGGGLAGLTAARAASEAGHDVVLVEDHPHLSGSGWRSGTVDGHPAADWIAEQEAAIRAAGGRILTATTAFGIYDHGMVGLAQNHGFATAPSLIRLRAGRVVLATGALDRPLTFANNDRPGIMSLHGAAEFLARYGVVVGQKIAVLSNNSLSAQPVAQLRDAGAAVEVLDTSAREITALGGKALSGVQINGTKHEADTLLVSGGMTPLVHLWRHAGGKLDWDETRAAYVPGQAPDNMAAVGAANGTFDTDAALDEARAAGLGKPAPRTGVTTYKIASVPPDPDAKGRQWIDFQHDVTLKDIAQAALENYVSVEHLKRYTTLGMAADQGKTSNMAALDAMAAIRGRPVPEIGTTTFRPPFVPQPLELYSGLHKGQLFHPLKCLPLEDQHRSANAALGEYGGWLRPGWYGDGDPEARAQAEARMARQTVGLFDASPLGKIEVMGPDSEAFVNFVYYNTMRTLKPGHIRYGFMLTEQGVVYDDGVAARLGAERFLISCSSSHADGVRLWLEAWRQDGNDPDRIFVHDLTEAWATLAVTGPSARAVLVAAGIDLGADPFPHMTVRDSHFGGETARIARVSFTGDASYEVSVRPDHAPALWSALLDATIAQGGGPIGIEALSILRAEKGYIMVGKDSDGETMPHDLGFDAPRQRKTAAFIGDRSLRSDLGNDPDRRQLVGLRVPDGAPPLPTGAHLVTSGETPRSIGIVTSSYQSPTLERPIALALLRRGRDRIGQRVVAWHLGQTLEAEVTHPCAFDPEGGRLDAE